MLREIYNAVLTPMPPGTLNGQPPVTGNPAHAGFRIVQEFGNDSSLQSNVDIINRVEEAESTRPLLTFASSSLVHALRLRGIQQVEPIVEGQKSADNFHENLGVDGEAKHMKTHIDRLGLSNPEFFTSAFNVGNAVRQAGKAGIIGCIIPPDLPRSFDRRSEQLWIRNRLLWLLTSKLRITILRAKGH